MLDTRSPRPLPWALAACESLSLRYTVPALSGWPGALGVIRGHRASVELWLLVVTVVWALSLSWLFEWLMSSECGMHASSDASVCISAHVLYPVI